MRRRKLLLFTLFFSVFISGCTLNPVPQYFLNTAPEEQKKNVATIVKGNSGFMPFSICGTEANVVAVNEQRLDHFQKSPDVWPDIYDYETILKPGRYRLTVAVGAVFTGPWFVGIGEHVFWSCDVTLEAGKNYRIQGKRCSGMNGVSVIEIETDMVYECSSFLGKGSGNDFQKLLDELVPIVEKQDF